MVELTPGMVYLGANLQEAAQLLAAHEEVLAKLQVRFAPSHLSGLCASQYPCFFVVFVFSLGVGGGGAA